MHVFPVVVRTTTNCRAFVPQNVAQADLSDGRAKSVQEQKKQCCCPYKVIQDRAVTTISPVRQSYTISDLS